MSNLFSPDIFQKLSNLAVCRGSLVECGVHCELVRLLAARDLLLLQCALCALTNLCKRWGSLPYTVSFPEFHTVGLIPKLHTLIPMFLAIFLSAPPCVRWWAPSIPSPLSSTSSTPTTVAHGDWLLIFFSFSLRAPPSGSRPGTVTHYLLVYGG